MGCTKKEILKTEGDNRPEITTITIFMHVCVISSVHVYLHNWNNNCQHQYNIYSVPDTDLSARLALPYFSLTTALGSRYSSRCRHGREGTWLAWRDCWWATERGLEPSDCFSPLSHSAPFDPVDPVLTDSHSEMPLRREEVTGLVCVHFVCGSQCAWGCSDWGNGQPDARWWWWGC